MVWRATAFFPPIFIGIVTYLIWKRGLAKGTYANDPDVARCPRFPLTGEAPDEAGAAPR